MLHEVEPRKYTYMGNRLKAVREKINNAGYITFKNETGKPHFIFPEKEARILRVTQPWQGNMFQLLLRVGMTHYFMLTFSNHSEAEKFGEALLKYVKPLHMGHVFHNIRDRFKNNTITIGPKS